MGFFDKLFSGLTKTRNNMDELEELFRDYAPDSEDFYDDLEELLVLSDVGLPTAEAVIKGMRKLTWERRFRKGYEAREGLIELLSKMLASEDNALKLTTKPAVILMVGVNGVGKTTTIGKLSHQLKEQGKKVMLIAGDTFRAAAAEQLGIWAERSGADFVRHEEGSDPAAVVFDAIASAKAKGTDVILVDTAGRLHNKKNLMNELSKINRVIDRELPNADRRNYIVLDATTGQNAVSQVEVFDEAIDIDGIILTKLDGTAKGGVVMAISAEYEMPVVYIGVGEKIDDLLPFNATEFVNAIL